MIVDVVAATLVLVGALVMLLGSVGLVRFPDVFTRMHASAKAGVVGVIAITGAAALEADTVGGLLVLAVVIVLLFLSGPLGMTLLARAAYGDPETPKARRTSNAGVQLAGAETSGIRSTGRTGPVLTIWLLVVWVGLFGSVTIEVLVGGAVATGAVAFALRTFAPRWPGLLRRPVHAVRFVGFFAGQLSAGTWDVIRTLFVSPGRLRPAIVEVPLRVGTRNETSLLMNAISFTPGTVALDLRDGRLLVHVLNTDDPGGVVGGIAELESHISRAFGRGGPVGETEVT